MAIPPEVALLPFIKSRIANIVAIKYAVSASSNVKIN